MNDLENKMDFPSGPLLGVDYGTVRIGLAVSDRDQKIAVPFRIYQRQTPALDARFFTELSKSQEIVGLIVGLPLHLSGAEGAKAKEARQFAAWLRQTTGLPVAFCDERYSSVEAWNYLKEGGLKAARRKKQLDKVAAQVILQSYLDARKDNDSIRLEDQNEQKTAE